MWCMNPLVEQQVRQEQYSDMIREARRDALAKGFRLTLTLGALAAWLRPVVWRTDEHASLPQQTALSQR